MKVYDFRPTKSLWHGHGLSFDTSGSAPTATAPPGTCRGWHSDSALEVGFATNLLDKSASFLAAQRYLFILNFLCVFLKPGFFVCQCESSNTLYIKIDNFLVVC